MLLLKKILPFFILFTLCGLLARALFAHEPNEMPSALIGEDIPVFHLPTLSSNETYLDSKSLQGQVILLNVWATWCYACRLELPTLKKIQTEFHIPIYSIAYKDDPIAVQKWLHQYGNPYQLTALDTAGEAAIDLGVYGTPETFVISPQGKIVYRHVGAIDERTWKKVLLPIIKKYQS